MSVCLCVSVSVFVCPRSYLPNYTSDLHHFLCMLPMAVAWSSATSGFMDDVISVHKPRLHDVEARCTRSLGFGYKLCALIPVAGQRTHWATFRALTVASQVATPGAMSAVYDCLVLMCDRNAKQRSKRYQISLDTVKLHLY